MQVHTFRIADSLLAAGLPANTARSADMDARQPTHKAQADGPLTAADLMVPSQAGSSAQAVRLESKASECKPPQVITIKTTGSRAAGGVAQRLTAADLLVRGQAA